MKEIYNLIDKLENETFQDKEQIKRALKVTKYTIYNSPDSFGEKISRKKATEILGNEQFVSGLERAAFHYTAFRSNGVIGILFDSSELFKEV